MVTATTTAGRPHRVRWLVVWVAASLALAGGAFALGTQVRSPSEEAAANSRRVLPVTATVAERTVTAEESVIVGTASLGVTKEVRAQAEGHAVVTGVFVAPGDALSAGTVAVEVNSRPLIALHLPFALFRDLTPGLEGSDVAAVQAALRDLGLYRGAHDGVYGPSTSAAVRALYQRVHVRAPASVAAQTTPAPSPAAAPAADGAVPPAPVPTDTPLPAAEVLALPDGDATVVSVAEVGADLTDAPVLTLRSGSATVIARAASSVAAQLGVGAEATVTDAADAGRSAPATVSAVSEFRPGATDDGLPPGYDVTLTIHDAPFAEGARVVVTPAQQAPSTTGPAVPLTAVRQDQQGEYVVRTDDAARIPVRVLATGGGWVVVDSELAIGDVVTVSE